MHAAKGSRSRPRTEHRPSATDLPGWRADAEFGRVSTLLGGTHVQTTCFHKCSLVAFQWVVLMAWERATREKELLWCVPQELRSQGIAGC